MAGFRVVITGVGVISSIGTGRDEFWNNLSQGKSGVKPITLFDTSDLKVKTACEISDFNPKKFLGDKGLRTLDRSTKLVNCAVKLALDDAAFQVNGENTDAVGVAIGSTLGSVSSISDFDRESLKEGPQYVNPALFPNTVINSPASQVSIKFGIKGFNATISTGFSASLDAVNYAADFIRLGRANLVVTGGVEELCAQIFLGFYKLGLLDKGVVLGEGACIFVLEELESAITRKANIYAEALGFGSSLDGIEQSQQLALKEAGLKLADIDYISSVDSLKALIGECFSASGAFQIAEGLNAINKRRADKVLISAFGQCGLSSSLIVSRFNG